MFNISNDMTANESLKDSPDKLIVVGDRVLIRPVQLSDKTKGGLFLPPGYKEKEEIHTGYVIKVGPGYPIPTGEDIDEPWKKAGEKIKYIPLQAKVGDKAIFLQKGAIEIVYNEEKYFLVPQYSILLLERDEELFE
jgi:co-chaperonin GroES (HSP10)